MYVVRRSKHNPILVPDKDNYWESFAVFNPCPVKHGKFFYCFYRAISAADQLRTPDRVSVIGKGVGKDGIHFDSRSQFIVPTEDWEKYGCEDPRATYFEGKYYIFYTALANYPFSADGIKCAVAVSKDLKKVDERHLVTPFNAKAMTLFSERVGGKVTVILSAHTDSPPARIVIAQADKIEDLWNEKFWEKWQVDMEKNVIDPRRTPYDHVEVGAPPIKTKYGWLLVYAYIQNYFPNPDHLERVFGIEALLLDLKDPRKTIGRTEGPIIVPSESYELNGYVPNVVFPSGALVEGDTLSIYYGAADTAGAVVRMSLSDLVSTMSPKTKDDWTFRRSYKNPILLPVKEHKWESKAVFNPAAVRIGDTTHILYRALSDDNTSTIGYAATRDGETITERSTEPIYVPREEFELKKIDGGNSGCEDPRLTKIGNTLYMCYTAFDGIGPPRVAITSISEKNFLEHNWNWEKPIIITPPGFDDKDTCLFPEKTSDGYFVLHRVGGDICGDYFKSLNFKTETVKKCIRIIGPRANAWDSRKVGIAAPPIKTKYGWLLLYHGISKSHGTYRTGAVLLDKKDPSIVLARITDPVFSPKTGYEKIGIVNNVVFPCGMTVQKGFLYIYYGGADEVVGVASIDLKILLGALSRGAKI